MNEKEKMLAGKIYDNTFEDEEKLRKEILDELVPEHGDGIFLQGPIYFDYGVFTSIGKNTYANFNFTVLDSAPVKIGDNVFFGPNCTIASPVHPLRYQDRNMKCKENGNLYDDEYAKPVTIGSNCWIASNVVIAGRVTIGEGCVIGAGSVVTRDIPPNSLAVGSPCRVIREITEKDAVKYREELF